MKKIIFGIFAHPDDEAFIVAGTLLKEARSGTELHLITLTNGKAGTNPDNVPDLGEVRLREWHEAGKLLGATTMHHLGFEDGTLGNSAMIEATGEIESIVADILHGQTAETEVEFMTFDLNGLTGHIDHIAASRAACQVFYRQKIADNRFTRVRLACSPASLYPSTVTNWIYMEPGRSAEEIDETIDAREFHDEILRVMHAHHSQRGDANTHIKNQGANLGLNYFIVKR